jgi:regulator of protease activity HflC (stomatin/prohibitin superfamily)
LFFNFYENVALFITLLSFHYISFFIFVVTWSSFDIFIESTAHLVFWFGRYVLGKKNSSMDTDILAKLFYIKPIIFLIETQYIFILLLGQDATFPKWSA